MLRWRALYRIWIVIILAGTLTLLLVLKERQHDRDQTNLSYEITANGWFFAQMQFELMRLSRALTDLMNGETNAEDVAFRFEIAISRSSVLKGSLMGKHPGVAEGIDEFERFVGAQEETFFSLDPGDAATLRRLRENVDGLAKTFHAIWIDEYAAEGYRHILYKPSTHADRYNLALGILILVMVGYLAVEATNSRRTAQRETEARRRADAANAARSLFLANMSHELRTPLNGVLGVAELLAHTPLDDRQADLVQVIKSSGGALMTIIADILEFSKIENAGVALDEEPFDLVDMIEGTVNMMSVEATKKGLEISLHVADGFPDRVVADQGRFRQIAINLIGNAVKFTDRGSVDIRLGLASEHGPPAVELTVDDSGPGVDPLERQAIFEPFRQAKATARRPDGTGLGLAICQKVVTAMSGEIGVSGRAAGGSSFWVRVPVGDLAPESAADAPGGGVPEVPRILIIEPRASSRAALAARLRHRGVGVGACATAVEAMSAMAEANAAARPFGVILASDRIADTDGDRMRIETVSGVRGPLFVSLRDAAGAGEAPDPGAHSLPVNTPTRQIVDYLRAWAADLPAAAPEPEAAAARRDAPVASPIAALR